MTATTTQVRVGVRVRPLTANEHSQGGKKVVVAQTPTVGIGKRKFTYDAVFDDHISQSDLYNQVAPPLLKSFLDGYNATIMAYGQTGSGKTFTMGSEAHSDGETVSHPGLIPRFMETMFASLQQKKDESDSSTGSGETVLLDFSVSASFLEVYGEDVHDLLDKERKPLPLREDAKGGVVVAGLKTEAVSTAKDALNVLHVGTLHRTTAATLMNLTSSRSHAVFTVYLTQTTRSSNGGNVDVTTTSKFTFVDLAGSERMKKTGAEGERAREGIKINEGLLALGNVINALADEERLAKKEKVHVPYRQSKLTRLLQDALGGNSQTFFLACVSPSDTNASETLSTLHYANRARNIKNVPTKNVDATVLELQRLHTLNHVLQSELIKNRFESQNKENIGVEDNELMQREDVKGYIEHVYKAAAEKQGSSVASSSFPAIAAAPMNSPTFQSGYNGEVKTPSFASNQDSGHIPRTPLLPPFSARKAVEDNDLEDVNPTEEMAILDQLLDLQHQDQEFHKTHKEEQEQLKLVNGELEEQETMLLQLKGCLKVYHKMKEKYEVLMTEVQQLETEKMSLADQLERTTADPTKGCSIAIKKKLEKVEANLARARSDARKHQQMYRKAEQQAKKCEALQRKITTLKQGKANLMKKQKEAAVKHREYTESKTREIMSMKRKERNTSRKVSKLQAEIQIHKNNLVKRQAYGDKLASKLKQTEDHLMKLLAMRKRELQQRTKAAGPPGRRGLRRPNRAKEETFASDSEELTSMSHLLSTMIADRVSQYQMKLQYEDRVTEYSEIMRNMVSEVRSLEVLRKELDESASNEKLAETIQSHEQNVEDLEIKIELVGAELEDLRSKLVDTEDDDEEEQDFSRLAGAAKTAIGNLDAPIMRTLLWKFVERLAKSKIESQSLTRSKERKDSALQSLENEVDMLNNKIKVFSDEIAMRQNLSESGEDPIEVIKGLREEMTGLHEQVDVSKRDKNTLETRLLEVQRSLSVKEIELSETKEKLTLSEVILRQEREGVHASEETLRALQGIWQKIGVSTESRDKVRLQIMSCLEDTCKRKLDEANALLRDTESEIKRCMHRLSSMRSVLGNPEKPFQRAPDETSLQVLGELNRLMSMIQPEFESACERRTKIVHAVRGLVFSMSGREEDLSPNLCLLLEAEQLASESKLEKPANLTLSAREQRTERLKDVAGMLEAVDALMDEKPEDNTMSSVDVFTAPTDYGAPNSLEETFLDSCDKDLTQLRLSKSSIVVRNSEVQRTARTLAKELHVTAENITSFAEKFTFQESGQLPEWWDTEMASAVAQCITDLGGVVKATVCFTNHLDAIMATLSTLSESRRLLSDSLKDIIERAQKTLLMTVGEEVDASEAYASFHTALFKLPSLSQEHVEVCISEMKALVTGVEAMTQSEIEALTVVWEALTVDSSSRGKFWEDLEETTKKLKSRKATPFGEITKCGTIEGEEWLLKAATDADDVYRQLDARLLKLENIHGEVEKLRSKQDTKSKIISLDSEIRILDARLKDFEENKCNKERLVSKKTGSAPLLKEEQFRKQMKGKFAAKLEELTAQLKIWNESEDQAFDGDLLSEEARAFLANPDKMDSMVKERIKFMDLRTVNCKTAGGKRSAEKETLEGSSPKKRVKSNEKGNPSKQQRPFRTTGRSSKVEVAPSTKRARSTRGAKEATVKKRKPNSRSNSPTKPKKFRATRESEKKREPLSPNPPKNNAAAVKPPSTRMTRSTSNSKRDTLLPFGHLLSEASPRKDKENVAR